MPQGIHKHRVHNIVCHVSIIKRIIALINSQWQARQPPVSVDDSQFQMTGEVLSIVV